MNARRIAPIGMAITAVLATAAMWSMSPSSPADETRRRVIAVRFEGGVARLDVRARDLADDAFVARIQSGLPQTISTRVEAHLDRPGPALATSERLCVVSHDLWLRTYRVRIDHGEVDRTEPYDELDPVLARCVDLEGFAVGSAADWERARGEEVSFSVRHELNPMSAEAAVRMRRWLSYPDGSTDGDEAFFGSFVGLFLTRRVDGPERSLAYRSAEGTHVP